MSRLAVVKAEWLNQQFDLKMSCRFYFLKCFYPDSFDIELVVEQAIICTNFELIIHCVVSHHNTLSKLGFPRAFLNNEIEAGIYMFI